MWYVLSYTIQNFVDDLDKTLKNKRPFCLQDTCPLYLICAFIVEILTFLQIAKYVIVSCELTDLMPGISKHFVCTVVMEESTQV